MFLNALAWFAIFCAVLVIVSVNWQTWDKSAIMMQVEGTYNAYGRIMRRSLVVLVVSILWLLFG